jgi:hypothetical protein
MTDLKRWLDELPADSPERSLLVAGQAARPPADSCDSGWRALTLALGTTSALTVAATEASAAATTVGAATATTTAATTAAQAAAVSVAKAAQSAGIAANLQAALPVAAAAKTAVGVSGLSLGAKALAIGFAMGLGVLGAGTVTERVMDRHASMPAPRSSGADRESTVPRRVSAESDALYGPGAASGAPATSDTARAPGDATAAREQTPDAPGIPIRVTERVAEPSQRAASGPANARRAAVSGANVESSQQRIDLGASVTELAPPSLGSAAPASTSQAGGADAIPLAEQARELAQIQRLVQAGATAEALRRLEAHRHTNALSGLGEERDALYVQALAKAQHTEQARFWGNRFLQRYPNSAHAEKIRRLILE